MKCPVCGAEAYLVGLSNQNYPAAFRCYNGSAHRHEYNFSSDHVGVDRAEADRIESASRSASRDNAAAQAARARGR